MKKILQVFLSICLIQSASAQKPTDTDRKITGMVDNSYGRLFELYKFLHANPEISFQEKNTMAKIAAQLKESGFEVTQNFGGYGLVGVLKNGPGPTILVRTDLDALPVKEETGLPYASKATAKDDQGRDVPAMHACGHDLHMSVFTGTAQVLAQLKSTWKGTLVFIGQPAEERSGGAIAMLNQGLYEKFPPKPHHRIRAEAQVKPLPKAARHTKSPGLIRPCAKASLMAIGIEAAVVLP